MSKLSTQYIAQSPSPQGAGASATRRARLAQHGLVVGLVLATWSAAHAHDPNATITWNREISRIVFERCASCHREGGTSFSLTTYREVQPRAAAIKDAVLSRRMPPWGAVKGFGDFRNDQGLTQEQISVMTTWVETGALRGNNPNVLPPLPKFESQAQFAVPRGVIPVSGDLAVTQAIALGGLLPEHVPHTSSIQVVAALPDGSIEPLVWLYEYRDAYQHPFLFRKVLRIPAGSVIRGVPRDARILLIPALNGT